jgi:Domain of unknown function (DUF1707)
MPDAADLRASDAEREGVVDELREQSVAGRLDPADLEERVHDAYRARTRGELARLTADLPARESTQLPAPRRQSEWLRRRLASFVTVNSMCVAVWAATGAHGGFWPSWVMLGTGIPLFSALVHRGFGVQPHRGRRRRDTRVRRDQRGSLAPAQEPEEPATRSAP